VAHPPQFGNQQPGFMPRAKQFMPATGLEGLPNLFGDNPLGFFAQMYGQQLLASQMANMGMAPMGISDTNVFDRLKEQRFTASHRAFVAEQAELDRGNYMRTMQGMANAADTPVSADLHAAMQAVASFAVTASPELATAFPEAIDVLGGQRGSSAVMAHYMHMGGKHRIDPATGRMGMSNASLKDLMSGVYGEMFAGDKYLQEPLSAGRAGQLFQELNMRGMMPGAASLEMLQRNDPLRMQNLYSQAGIDNDRDAAGKLRSVTDLNPQERAQLLALPAVEQDLKSFDAKRVTGALRDWGKSLEAMREIFGDAGYPNAPMPVLIDQLNRLTGGGMSQLDPSQVTDMVRTTANLASQSGIGMEAATLMTQQAMMQAQAMGLDPVFGALAAQNSLAFSSAYIGTGAGAYQEWGRGNLAQHQQFNQQLFLRGAASQVANQFGAALRLDETEAFDTDTDAARFVEAAKFGQTEFRNSKGELQSLDMSEDDFAKMIASSGRTTAEQARFMLEQQAANAEFLVRTPEALRAVRQLQGREFTAEQGRVATAVAGAVTAQQLGGQFNSDKMEGTLEVLGNTAMETFMGSTGDVAADRTARNRAMSIAMRRKIEERAATGDAGAQTLLDSFAGDDEKRDRYLNDLSEGIYASVDQRLRDTGQGTLQDRHAVHSPVLLRQTEREQDRAKAKAIAQEALAPLGKGGILRRGVEALMRTKADDENPLLKIFASAMGGVQGDKIAKALLASDPDRERLGRIQPLNAQLEAAQEDFANADTPEAKKTALAVVKERAKALNTEVVAIQTQLEGQGLLFTSKIQPGDVGDTIRHMKFTQDNLQAGLAAPQDTQEGKEKYTTARRAVHSHIRNIEDVAAKFMADEATMLRLGQPGLDNVKTLLGTNKELHALALEKFDGDLMKAMDSTGGKDILKRQAQALDYSRKSIGDPTRHYEYLGDKAHRDKLQGIASRLFEAKELPRGTMESLLDLDDKGLEKLKKTDTLKQGLTDEELTEVKAARNKREAVIDKYNDFAADYRKEGKDVLQSTFKAITNDDSLTAKMLELDAKGGHKLSRYLQGTGVGNQQMRAYFEEVAKAAQEYNDPDSGLTADQRKALKTKHGAALDIFRGDDDTAREQVSPEEAMQFFNQKIKQAEQEFGQQQAKGGEQEGSKHYSIAHLIHNGTGGADFYLSDEDPQGA